jgi:hypothetical protein
MPSCATKDAKSMDGSHPRLGGGGAAQVLLPCRGQAAEEVEDRTVVTADLTGDFPGNPVDLRYRFKLVDSPIISLDIANARRIPRKGRRGHDGTAVVLGSRNGKVPIFVDHPMPRCPVLKVLRTLARSPVGCP